jgi:hypothetical protein
MEGNEWRHCSGSEPSPSEAALCVGCFEEQMIVLMGNCPVIACWKWEQMHCRQSQTCYNGKHDTMVRPILLASETDWALDFELMYETIVILKFPSDCFIVGAWNVPPTPIVLIKNGSGWVRKFSVQLMMHLDDNWRSTNKGLWKWHVHALSIAILWHDLHSCMLNITVLVTIEVHHFQVITLDSNNSNWVTVILWGYSQD